VLIGAYKNEADLFLLIISEFRDCKPSKYTHLGAEEWQAHFLIEYPVPTSLLPANHLPLTPKYSIFKADFCRWDRRIFSRWAADIPGHGGS